MSYWCQFCDKEMRLQESIVEVNHYITCGGASCEAKAKETAEAIYQEELAKSRQFDVILFSTKTPEDDESWRGVEEDDYPMYINDPEIMAKMLEGCSIYIEDEDLHYAAMKTQDYIKLLGIEAS